MKPFDGYIAMDKEEKEPPFTTRRRTVWKYFEDAIIQGYSVYVTVIKTDNYKEMQAELTRLREYEARAKLLEAGQKQARDRDRGGRMRAYMGYSRGMGPQEGAVLVIANTAREAKPLAWGAWGLFDVDEYTDIAIRWLRDDHIMALADQKKLAADEPHVIDSPVGCKSCELWGCGVRNDGTCCYCDGPAGDELVRIIEKWRRLAGKQTHPTERGLE